MKYEISTAELIYLSARAGLDTFPGARECFENANEAQMREIVMEIENSLQEKSYLVCDFDGNASINEKLLKVILDCGNCESFLCMEIMPKGEIELKSCFFYRNENRFYQMILTEENQIIEEISVSDAKARILEGAGLDAVKTYEDADLADIGRISQNELSEIREMLMLDAGDQAEEALREAGFSEKMTSCLTVGMSHHMSFHSLIVNSEETADGVQYYKGDSLLGLTPVYDEDEDFAEFRFLRKEDLEKKIEGFFEIMKLEDLTDEFA